MGFCEVAFPSWRMEGDAAIVTTDRFRQDPRHEWWASYLVAKGFQPVGIEQLRAGPVGTINVQGHPSRPLATLPLSIPMLGFEASDVTLIRLLWSRVREEVAQIWHPFIDELDKAETDRGATQSFLASYFKTSISAFHLLRATGWRPSVAVSCTLPSAIAVDMMWPHSDTFHIYDAQEMFAEQYDYTSYPLSAPQRRIWARAENIVALNADVRVSVSPKICEILTDRSGVHFDCVPNFSSRETLFARDSRHERRGALKAVFMGGAAEGRGLDHLVRQWNFKPEEAELHLFIPESEGKAHLKASLQEKDQVSIFLHEAVSEEEMVSTLRCFDVGVLPYDFDYPYSEASPNKLGQYVAAGLPVVANDQSFVASVLREWNLGLVFSWHETDSFGSAIRELKSTSTLLASLKANSIKAFQTHLNWETAVSRLSPYLPNPPINHHDIEIDVEEVVHTLRFLSDSLSSTGVNSAVIPSEVPRRGFLWASVLSLTHKGEGPGNRLAIRVRTWLLRRQWAINLYTSARNSRLFGRIAAASSNALRRLAT